MTQPGYQEGSDRVWWWRIAQHLDSAQIALINAMAHNVDDPSAPHALQDHLRVAQTILLEIFGVKGLLPQASNGHVQQPQQPQQPPQPPPFAFAGAPPQPPEAANGAVAVEVAAEDIPPTAATVPPPMIVTDDVPVDPATEPVAGTET